MMIFCWNSIEASSKFGGETSVFEEQLMSAQAHTFFSTSQIPFSITRMASAYNKFVDRMSRRHDSVCLAQCEVQQS